MDLNIWPWFLISFQSMKSERAYKIWALIKFSCGMWILINRNKKRYKIHPREGSEVGTYVVDCTDISFLHRKYTTWRRDLTLLVNWNSWYLNLFHLSGADPPLCGKEGTWMPEQRSRELSETTGPGPTSPRTSAFDSRACMQGLIPAEKPAPLLHAGYYQCFC